MATQEMTVYKAIRIGIEEGMDREAAGMYIAMALLENRLTVEEYQALRAELNARTEPQP